MNKLEEKIFTSFVDRIEVGDNSFYLLTRINDHMLAISDMRWYLYKSTNGSWRGLKWMGVKWAQLPDRFAQAMVLTMRIKFNDWKEL